MTIKTTCPYCGVGCGVLAAADGTIKGDPDHPANFGRLCSKGSALGETIDLEGRLLTPQINGQVAEWDTALDLVASRFAAAIRDHGPDSVAFYVSGQLLTEDYYVANKLMKGYMGSANIDTNSRLCMASSVAGHKRAFGTDTVPGTYEDLEQADLVVLVGSNLAWCHPVLFQRIVAAKSARPNMRVVNIDPRKTATSGLADLHLSVAPDGDIALFNGLLCHLADTGAVDGAYVAEHVNGFGAALTAARASNPKTTGLSDAELAAFYQLWAGTQKVVTVYSQGVNQSACGTDKVNAIINCHLATGRIGQAGMGPFSVTGQPNAMGGREVGGLANMLANHLDIENAAHREAVQNFWNSPTICTKPGLKAVDLFDACASGQIKALWIMSTNPAVSLPDANRVAAAIAAVPFTVVSDIMARTDTGDLADVLLPATGWGEKSGTVTNSERMISRQRPFLPAPGAARPDWQILAQVAARMGWADAFDYTGPDQIFREYAGLSETAITFARDLDLTGLADINAAAYDDLAPVQWPVSKLGPTGGRFFAKGRFYHPDGRARMLPIAAPEITQGLRLNTGRVRDQWHTMTRTGKSPRLGAHLAEPFVEIHPEDARIHGIAPATLVAVSSPQGHSIFRALITDRVQKGQVFAPMHWTRQNSAHSGANSLVAAVVDPVSGQPALKGSMVAMQPFAAAWYGFVASQTQITPAADYCAVARSNTGWTAELAGMETPNDWAGFLAELTGQRGGEVSSYLDAKTGQTRIAMTQDGAITALLFVGAAPVALQRRNATQIIGQSQPALAALAGRPAGNTPDEGAILCSCFSIGVNAIQRAIADGANSLAEIGARTCAGTNCGSCRPEITALLTVQKPALAAE
ncbi:molybdopterin-dependent oxidoreductase [Pseudorhodobacter sp. W20_MBD10_FR17]|uniref:nitrate reductase n=1 Tax=Pseudorhodobacter sp. W20_MBD10_FR17 TaxID=3240266 RepID=UPI003F9C0489